MRPPEQIGDRVATPLGTPVLPAGRPGLPSALYIHIPFCAARCHYCDFVTYTTLGASIEPYIDALTAEISGMGEPITVAPALRTLYLGGGTPSLLSPQQLARILAALRRVYGLDPGLELTLEANPGDVSIELLTGYRRCGVNRLSLGMQSAGDGELRLLGRRHTHEETRLAVHRSRLAGLQNVSLDLIYGLPGQTLGDWAGNLDAALALEPDHLSAYCLTIEAGTRLGAWVRRGQIEPGSDDLAAEMVEWLGDRLSRAGFTQYEIANWAAGPAAADGFPAFACRHNLTYWMNQPYLGVGAGAHGYWAGVRYANVTRVADYIRRVRGQGERPPNALHLPAATRRAQVGEQEASRDTLLLGLRLTAGVSVEDYLRRHGSAAWERERTSLDRLHGDGLIEWTQGGRRVRLTPRGRMLGNRVFAEFA